MKSDPGHQLPRDTVTVWRITDGFQSLLTWVIPVGYYAIRADMGLPFWGVYPLSLLVVVYTVLQATWLPLLRWRYWRYEVDQHEIDLKHGIFVVNRTLVPIKRVQHVDTRQGPVQRYFGLAGVRIYTAATVHEIPSLGEHEAESVRDRISEFARIALQDEEDV